MIRLWRDIGSQGTLWTWVNLCAHRGNLGSMPGILRSARFPYFDQICVHKSPARFSMVRKITVRANLSNEHLHEVTFDKRIRR